MAEWGARASALGFREDTKQGVSLPWPEEEFGEQEVTLVSGNVTTMWLAERGVYLGEKVRVREIRRLTASGHQTAIVETDYRSDLAASAASMFARWCQENFFRYMREHYDLDGLVEYGTEEIPASGQPGT